MKPSATRLLSELATILGEHSVRWYVFGAQAVNVWGRPRMTADVDVTIEPTDRMDALVQRLASSAFDPLVEMDRQFLADSPVLPFLHTPTGMPLDIVVGRSGLEAAFLDRVTFVSFEDVQLPIVSPGDLIVLKLIAGRPKDIDDARGVVLAQRDNLDVKEIRSLLVQVEEALNQSDLVEEFERMLP